MHKITCSLALLCLSLGAFAQLSDELAIRKILADQTTAWNKGSIEDFMKDYWENDSLVFIGQSGISYGYEKTLANYKKNYGNLAAMGVLYFSVIKAKKLSPQYYFVIGKWFLKRTAGNLGGYSTLLFRKINGEWVIITDHSS
jgi:hypothetical protein